jgi:hypothetical protein
MRGNGWAVAACDTRVTANCELSRYRIRGIVRKVLRGSWPLLRGAATTLAWGIARRGSGVLAMQAAHHVLLGQDRCLRIHMYSMTEDNVSQRRGTSQTSGLAHSATHSVTFPLGD